MQLTAAIAPDGNQRNIADLPKPVIDPQTLQQLVDKFGARFNQLLGRYARVERAAQPAAGKGFNMLGFEFGAQVSSCVLASWRGNRGSGGLC